MLRKVTYEKKTFPNQSIFAWDYESEIILQGTALEIRFFHDLFLIYHIKLTLYDNNGGPVGNWDFFFFLGGGGGSENKKIAKENEILLSPNCLFSIGEYH